VLLCLDGRTRDFLEMSHQQIETCQTREKGALPAKADSQCLLRQAHNLLREHCRYRNLQSQVCVSGSRCAHRADAARRRCASKPPGTIWQRALSHNCLRASKKRSRRSSMYLSKLYLASTRIPRRRSHRSCENVLRECFQTSYHRQR
jgi:hypothetical protein